MQICQINLQPCMRLRLLCPCFLPNLRSFGDGLLSPARLHPNFNIKPWSSGYLAYFDIPLCSDYSQDLAFHAVRVTHGLISVTPRILSGSRHPSHIYDFISDTIKFNHDMILLLCNYCLVSLSCCLSCFFLVLMQEPSFFEKSSSRFWNMT